MTTCIKCQKPINKTEQHYISQEGEYHLSCQTTKNHVIYELSKELTNNEIMTLLLLKLNSYHPNFAEESITTLMSEHFTIQQTFFREFYRLCCLYANKMTYADDRNKKALEFCHFIANQKGIAFPCI